MNGAPAILLLPGILTLLLYLVALLVVASSRSAAFGRRRDPRARIHRELPARPRAQEARREPPRLRVIAGGAAAGARAAGR